MFKRIALFIYGVVSYFIYVGWLFAFWMTPVMTLAHLVFALGTTLYILAAIQFEERDLVREHGHAYEDYRRRVPMLVPSGGHASGGGVASYAQNPSDLPFGPPYGEEL